MSWNRWKLGLVVAIITGFFSGGVVAFVDPDMPLKKLAFIVAYFICQNALLFLKDHPVDRISDGTEVFKKTTMLFACGILGASLMGCQPLQVNADPLIVRAEQTERAALATFDLVVNVDHANRAFFEKHAPEFHSFAEWLREPIPQNGQPRGLAMVADLHAVKMTYKETREAGKLQASIYALQATLARANGWLNQLTNSPSTK